MVVTCPRCNAYNADDSAYCMNCGAALNIVQSNYQPVQTFYEANIDPRYNQIKKSRKNMVIGFSLVVIILIVLAVLIFVVFQEVDDSEEEDNDDETNVPQIYYSHSLYNSDWESGCYFRYNSTNNKIEWSSKRSGPEPWSASVAGYGNYSLMSDEPHLTIQDFSIDYVESDKYGTAPRFGLCYDYKIQGGANGPTTPFIGFEISADTDHGGTDSSVGCRLVWQKDEDSEINRGTWGELELYEGQTYKIDLFIEDSILYLSVDGIPKLSSDVSDLGTQNYRYLFYRCYGAGGSSVAKVQGWQGQCADPLQEHNHLP